MSVDATGNKECKELALYALVCLMIPVSNNTVEKLLSMENFVKRPETE